jgi:hypothetical protein
MSKTLCKKKGKSKKLNDKDYKCSKCDLTADKKKKLCKPEKL